MDDEQPVPLLVATSTRQHGTSISQVIDADIAFLILVVTLVVTLIATLVVFRVILLSAVIYRALQKVKDTKVPSESSPETPELQVRSRCLNLRY